VSTRVSIEPIAAFADLADRVDGLDLVTSRVAEVAEQLLGSTRAAISVWDEEREVLKVLSGAFGITGPELSSMVGTGRDMRSNAARVFATGTPYISNDAAGDPGILQNYVERHGIENVLSVPLRVGDRRIGVLHLVDKPEDFTPRDLSLAESLAPWVATAVQLGRSMTRLRVQRRFDGILARTAVAIASGDSLETSLLPAFEHVAAVMCGTVLAYVPRSGTPLIWRSKGRRDIALEARFLDDAQTCAPPSVWGQPRGPDDYGWAALHTPVLLYGERVASVSVLRERGVPMAPDEADALERLANLAALAGAAGREQRHRAELDVLQERQRIAEGLHDRVAQILFAAQIGLDTILEKDDGTDVERIREVRTLLTKGDTAIRNVIHRLAPAPDAGLGQRLAALVLDVEDEFAVPIVLSVDAGVEAAVAAGSRAATECLLKVAREAVVNAAKHARPCTVAVTLHVDPQGRVVLSVVDDGPGLATDAERRSSYGIPSMRRAVANVDGTLEFRPGPDGGGTMVRARVSPDCPMCQS
jgi:signal transduction histidine kinase